MDGHIAFINAAILMTLVSSITQTQVVYSKNDWLINSAISVAELPLII